MTFSTVAATGNQVPATQEVSITVEVVDQFSVQTPARIQITFQNTSERSREFLLGPDVPFGPLTGTSEIGAQLHAISDTRYYDSIMPPQPLDGCWKLAGEYGIPDRGVIWQANPHEEQTQTYVLLNEPKNERCLSSGVYRFEGTWGERYSTGRDDYFSWEFEVSLDRRDGR
ncbi:hypothetical protein [Haladaptatus sp. ZSTT2]|uniref:hypothetical protein n=1 Tax=Haladaptatus sp. ZSTT2 TaxID=3120515 RepID=UPI00300F0F15